MNTNELRILKDSFTKAIEPVARRRNYLRTVLHSEEHYNILTMIDVNKLRRIYKLNERLLAKERLLTYICTEILERKYEMINQLKRSEL